MPPMSKFVSLRRVALAAAAAATTCARAAALPEKVLALVATGPGQFALTNASAPRLGDLHRRFDGLPHACEVLVAVQGSSVNPADLGVAGPFPEIMGSDLAGTVLAVESSCKRLKVGDQVWGDIGAVVHAGSVKSKENGAYGQIAVALESQLGAKPKNLDFLEAGSLPKVALTSYKALTWYGGAPYAKGGTSVLVLGGSGGCGTTGILLAKAWGAAEIIATTSAANLEYVRGLGASRAIDYSAVNWWEALADGSVDVIYDTVGQAGTGDRAMAKLRSGGYYVTIVGALPSTPRQDVQSHMFINSNTNLENVELLDALRDLVEADKLRMRDVKTYALRDILAAFKDSQQGHVLGKLAIQLPPLDGISPKCTTGRKEAEEVVV